MDEYSGVSRHKRGRLFKTPSYSTFGIRIGLPVADGPLTVLLRTAIEDENGAGAYSISVGRVGLLLADDIVALAER